MHNSKLNIEDDSGKRSLEHPRVLLDQAVALVRDDINSVNQLIQTRLDSDIALIKTLGAYIIKSGGKRLRPLILLLCARACGYKGRDHITLAAVIEFIHTATLLHDDVVDASSLRRGQPTANEVWGNEASVLVGDFLYSRSFEMMVETNNMQVMDILAKTTNAIAEGEVLQLLNAHSPETTEEAYLQTIHRKTAKLFESAAGLGGVISSQDSSVCSALSKYGTHLGTAFQLIDDILDYDSNSDDLGKEIGDDLSEGKPTLPLIHALKNATPLERKIIEDAITDGDREKIDEILIIVRNTGALDYAEEQAKIQSRLAIDAITMLPDNQYKTSLISLANFSVSRNH
ncbi:MAG: octaprenyl diphosphate synthase [Gammaproteobacteria bacterium]|nr:octaprenyl diphosphate synthase [Gammaproteobacteria bacterium]